MRRLSSAQKKAAPGAPAYSILVNRPAGRLLAAAAYRAGLTPNMVTGISALFTFTGIACIALAEPTWVTGIVVWLLLAVGYAFDSADGQVARLRGGGSRAGEWLDHVVDSVKIVSLHLAVLISMFRFFDLPDGWLLVPIAFAIVATGQFFAMILNDQLKAVHRATTGVTVRPRTSASLGRSLLVLPTDYGILCLAFVLLGAPAVFLAAYSVLLLGNAGYFALASVKWFRDMVSLDAVPRDEVPADVVTGAALRVPADAARGAGVR
nr:CDP-alcohol phosphatidyltransferase family protein [Marisediminicola senii]